MEGFNDLITQFAVFPIALLCFGIGYVIKHYIKKIPNKFIPLILACVGLLLNLAFNQFNFTFDIVITGVCSGLVATGGFEAVRNLIKKNQNSKVE